MYGKYRFESCPLRFTFYPFLCPGLLNKLIVQAEADKHKSTLDTMSDQNDNGRRPHFDDNSTKDIDNIP